MNAERSSLEWLIDARHYAKKAQSLAVAARDQPDASDTLAIRYCLLIVGEALDWIPAGVLSREQGIPWRRVIALRHRLAHGYWLVDEDILLQIACNGNRAADLRTGSTH